MECLPVLRELGKRIKTMASKLNQEQTDKMVALMLIDSLIDQALENFLGEDLLDELDTHEIDIEISKKKMIRDIAIANNITKEDLVGRQFAKLASYLNVVMK